MKEQNRLLIACTIFASHLVSLILVFFLQIVTTRLEQIYYEIRGGLVLGGSNLVFFVLLYLFGMTILSLSYMISEFFKIEPKKK